MKTTDNKQQPKQGWQQAGLKVLTFWTANSKRQRWVKHYERLAATYQQATTKELQAVLVAQKRALLRAKFGYGFAAVALLAACASGLFNGLFRLWAALAASSLTPKELTAIKGATLAPATLKAMATAATIGIGAVVLAVTLFTWLTISRTLDHYAELLVVQQLLADKQRDA